MINKYGRNHAEGRRMVWPADQDIFCTKDTGYRGIWHGQTPSGDEYVYKYSGGLGTYPHQHRPFAIYSAEADKTFFCYGGTPPGWYQNIPNDTMFGEGQLLHMVSYFDHKTGKVPRPTILLDKWTADPHDNPVIALDDAGHIWIFSPSHGQYTTPSFIHRSAEPFSIESFDLIRDDRLMAYPQPWFVPGVGFIFMHTEYDEGRRFLRCAHSPSGMAWPEPVRLAEIERGHYQVSAVHGRKVGTFFNYHPPELGLERRTNVYYMESEDAGRTWQAANGCLIRDLPLTTVENPALVREYESQGRNVYLKDLTFDAEGRPVLLYITSGGHRSGPANDPRIWTAARWTGEGWIFNEITHSDNNYDMGPLYIEPDGTWRIIGPTEPGPQAYNPGGEMAVWVSEDDGAHWRKVRQLTPDSPRNHTFARRPVNAHPDFYALWADGDARQPSVSYLYFTDKADRVWRLPPEMDSDFAEPELLTT